MIPKPKIQKWTNWGKYQSCHKQFQRPLWTFQPYFLAAWTFSPTSPSKQICKRMFEIFFMWTFAETLTKENAEKLYPWWWGEPLWALTERLPGDWKAKWNVTRQSHLIIVTETTKRHIRSEKGSDKEQDDNYLSLRLYFKRKTKTMMTLKYTREKNMTLKLMFMKRKAVWGLTVNEMILSKSITGAMWKSNTKYWRRQTFRNHHQNIWFNFS